MQRQSSLYHCLKRIIEKNIKNISGVTQVKTVYLWLARLGTPMPISSPTEKISNQYFFCDVSMGQTNSSRNIQTFIFVGLIVFLTTKTACFLSSENYGANVLKPRFEISLVCRLDFFSFRCNHIAYRGGKNDYIDETGNPHLDHVDSFWKNNKRWTTHNFRAALFINHSCSQTWLFIWYSIINGAWLFAV